jgi:hypothetical protein
MRISKNIKSIFVLILFVCTIVCANTAWGGGNGDAGCGGGAKGDHTTENLVKAVLINNLLNAGKNNNSNPNPNPNR